MSPESLLGPKFDKVCRILTRGRHLIRAPLAENLDAAILRECASRAFEHGRFGAFYVHFEQIDLAGLVREIIVESNGVNFDGRCGVEPFPQLIWRREAETTVPRIVVSHEELQVGGVAIYGQI